MKDTLPQVIQGGSFSDARGMLRYVNDFDFDGIKRFYIIIQNKQAGPRAWQGHREETKYFFCIKGSFHVFLVKPDDWNSPSGNLETQHFHLTDKENRLLKIPAGYANGFIASDEQSSLLVFSDKTLEESKTDDYRFNTEFWINWNDYA